MSLDIEALRAEFPSLQSGIAHFDGPGGTQMPRPVAETMLETMTGPLSIRGHRVASERNAERIVGEFRSAYADFLGADLRGVVFGRSATQLTYDFSRHLAATWSPGDEVVVCRLDHDANIRPWIQAAESAGVKVRWIEFDSATSELDPHSIEEAITSRTRLVAVTAASNLLGTKPAVHRIAELAHAVGALVYIDGVHYAAHERVDIQALGADLFVCSPYKFLGPHCGVLAARDDLLESLHPDKLLPSTNDVPERFELGTLPYEMLAGATAAVDFLARVAPGGADDRPEMLTRSMRALHEHETRMRERIEAGILALGPDVILQPRAADRTPTLFATIPHRRTQDASEFLARRDVLAPAGSFYAVEAFQALALADDRGLRIGVAPYTSDDDVERLVGGLGEFVRS